ncbi:DUF3597 domain-containing protein [Sphingopyxis macrogoltabida]|uniref:DUF3597 domain-containing protein n=1 Tax=Sphingopyxis macrogoltabida TaxID=33050 RepID=A0A0N9V0V2_SPHMC|nr:DUF3597 domain-containing protein [Sphingopyxis macrogoltabida]ALH81919.1 hypothetical protein AN936_16605 [Sphingopyxis macrogoltabida]
MSIFGKIKDAIFGKKAQAAEPAAPATPAAGSVGAALDAATSAMASASAAPAPISEVDVEAILSAEAANAGQPLNWRTSIVDLMKLLGIDPSLDNRKELAKELGYTGELNGSAEMNIWLHKAVMRELAANGGRVPADLTD